MPPDEQVAAIRQLLSEFVEIDPYLVAGKRSVTVFDHHFLDSEYFERLYDILDGPTSDRTAAPQPAN